MEFQKSKNTCNLHRCNNLSNLWDNLSNSQDKLKHKKKVSTLSHKKNLACLARKIKKPNRYNSHQRVLNQWWLNRTRIWWPTSLMDNQWQLTQISNRWQPIQISNRWQLNLISNRWHLSQINNRWRLTQISNRWQRTHNNHKWHLSQISSSLRFNKCKCSSLKLWTNQIRWLQLLKAPTPSHKKLLASESLARARRRTNKLCRSSKWVHQHQWWTCKTKRNLCPKLRARLSILKLVKYLWCLHKIVTRCRTNTITRWPGRLHRISNQQSVKILNILSFNKLIQQFQLNQMNFLSQLVNQKAKKV